MSSESTLDLLAAARVSRRVEVKAIHLTEVQLTSQDADVVGGGDLRLEHFVHAEVPVMRDGQIQVRCTYGFTFYHVLNEDLAFTLAITYSVLYGLDGEPPDENDLRHFADANGRYHTWPFAREMVVSLTSKMGYTPFVLPALSFAPKVSQDRSDTPDEGADSAPAESPPATE